MKCTYPQTALSVVTQLGPKGDKRCPGVLSVFFKTPEMHIPPWLWFRSCVIVLIGSQTAGRKWVDYEIRKAWNDKKGLLGIYIHRLLNQDGKASTKGANPFANVRLQSGQTLNQRVVAYETPYTDSKDVYGYIKDHLERWVEDAIKNRRQ